MTLNILHIIVKIKIYSINFFLLSLIIFVLYEVKNPKIFKLNNTSIFLFLSEKKI